MALWPIYGWATPAIEFCVAFLLIGVENIGAWLSLPRLARNPQSPHEAFRAIFGLLGSVLTLGLDKS